MFCVIKLNDDKYAILFKSKRKKYYEGSKDYIIKTLLKSGVEEEEILYGMIELEHADLADYGINKKFIYSRKLVA